MTGRMRITARQTGLFGLGLLAVAWAGPLPHMAKTLFTAHMALHLMVVAVAAPLIAVGLNALWRGGIASAVAASFVEFVAVWGWHTPGLHEAARFSAPFFFLEQASFLLAGVLLWTSALREPASGVIGLLLTAMHMTLLGALVTLAPRPLYSELCLGGAGLTPIEDQRIGGVAMLAVGGFAYLGGGLALMHRLLRGVRT